MSNRKIWFITGAGRGMGVDFAKAALAAGHAVVASGRDRDGVAKSLGQSDDLLAVKKHLHTFTAMAVALIISACATASGNGKPEPLMIQEQGSFGPVPQLP